MKTLFSEEALRARIEVLGHQIRADYGDEPITAICVLKGSFMFLADLVRAIGGDVQIEFLGVSSYKGTESSGEVRITHGPCAVLQLLVANSGITSAITSAVACVMRLFMRLCMRLCQRREPAVHKLGG